MNRKAFLAAVCAGAVGCSTPAHPQTHETESMLLTRDNLLDLINIFEGNWWRSTTPKECLHARVRIWRKMLALTTPELREEFENAFLEDFLNNLDFVQFKYFIDNGGDQVPEDIEILKAAVRRTMQ